MILHPRWFVLSAKHRKKRKKKIEQKINESRPWCFYLGTFISLSFFFIKCVFKEAGLSRRGGNWLLNVPVIYVVCAWLNKIHSNFHSLSFFIIPKIANVFYIEDNWMFITFLVLDSARVSLFIEWPISSFVSVISHCHRTAYMWTSFLFLWLNSSTRGDICRKIFLWPCIYIINN